MKKKLAALLASSAIAMIAALAEAQTTAPASGAAAGSDLPPGLIRQGGVVMMQPLSDSDQRPAGATIFGGERRTALIGFLSASDHQIYSRAVDAAMRGDWTGARGLADQGRDPTARRIIEWSYLLDKNSGATFEHIGQFVRDNPGWPARNKLLARAEEAMLPTMDPHAVIAWFGDRPPQTGPGKIRLGEALMATGFPTRGRELIRQAWAEDDFDPDQELYVLSRHGDLLTPETDRARLDRLFARDQLTEARREIARVTVDVQRLATTRLLLRSDPVRGEQEAANLPAAMRSDPGLLFDEARALRQRNDIAPIAPLLARAPTRELAKLNPGRWWAELNIDVRAALQLGLTRDAYWLAANAGLPADSGEYAEAEFLAGWIALREQNQPRLALSHFKNLARTSAHPISRARAHYWIARAHEAGGDAGAAWQEYHAAGEDPGTFYGQLALAKITPDPSLHISATAVDASGERAAYEREDLTQAVHVLGDLGLESALREFALQDVDVRPDAAHVKLLAEDLTRMGFRDIAVRVAKEASYNGVRLPDYSHPVISLPRYSGPGVVPETAFVLAIIRQETEFDPNSVSGAGARGLMQLMPDSARRDAGLAGMSYNLSSLTTDSAYNIELGMTELADDLSEWGGSYVLAAASYNAGRGNVRRWIATFGDPRDARIDPVDWIEQIPFSETRNYVQRVLENTQVYRNRIAGRDEPLRILADLYRPMAPRLSVLRYAPPDAKSILPEPKPQPAPGAPGSSGPSANSVESGATVPTAPAPAVTPTFKPTSGTPGSPGE